MLSKKLYSAQSIESNEYFDFVDIHFSSSPRLQPEIQLQLLIHKSKHEAENHTEWNGNGVGCTLESS